MSEKVIWKIQYLNLCVNAFAKRFRLQPQVSYRYLSQYHAVSFLDENYEAEHIQPLEDTLDALRNICRRNGGSL